MQEFDKKQHANNLEQMSVAAHRLLVKCIDSRPKPATAYGAQSFFGLLKRGEITP